VWIISGKKKEIQKEEECQSLQRLLGDEEKA